MTDENKYQSNNVNVMCVDTVNLNEIIHKLNNILEYSIYPEGKRFSMSVKQQSSIYIIRSGSISCHRQPNDILLDLLHAPIIRGILPIHQYSDSIYMIKVIKQAEIAIVNSERFYGLLTEHNLWEPFARHMQQLATIVSETMFKLSSSSAFEIVRFQLYELMSKPLHIRESITAENYISSKTRLSRSAIFRVIADLKLGDYIVIENGILKEIKFIPPNY